MILQRLKEYSETIELPPPAYQKVPIKWLVKLNKNGDYLGLIKTEHEDKKGKSKGILHWAPNPGKRASGINPGLISDSADYVFGRYDEEEKRERTTVKHQRYISLLVNCETNTHSPEVNAIKTFFLENRNKEKSDLNLIGASDWVRFEVDGVDPTDLSDVRTFWTDKLEVGKTGTCLLCGKDRLLTRRQPVALKQIPGGQTSGVQLISANAKPFESYGLENSYIAPLCRGCSEATHHTINHLVASEQHSFRLGDKIVFIFWSMNDLPFSLKDLFAEATKENVKAFLESPYKGDGCDDIEQDDRLCCLGLAGAGGRAIVKEWIDTRLPSAIENLRSFFGEQCLLDDRPYHSIYSLAAATVRDLKDLPTHVPIFLIRAAMLDKSLPLTILTTTLRRCAIGHQSSDKRKHVTSAQASLIKLCLAKKEKFLKYNIKESMMKLDLNFYEPAYLYGRLFYLLERIQNAASGGGGVQRTFGEAMISPNTALPRLIARAKQSHLPRLQRNFPKLYAWFQHQMIEILNKLDSATAFKSRLQPDEQGFFVLGYYHQRAQKKNADN